jgi:hypothetical protein
MAHSTRPPDHLANDRHKPKEGCLELASRLAETAPASPGQLRFCGKPQILVSPQEECLQHLLVYLVPRFSTLRTSWNARQKARFHAPREQLI